MSAAAKYTPGPWKATRIEAPKYGRQRRAEMDYAWAIEPRVYIDECCEGTVDPPHFAVARIPIESGHEHEEANARLIAAAPVLVEALEDLLAASDPESDPHGPEEMATERTNARAALKAAGVEP